MVKLISFLLQLLLLRKNIQQQQAMAFAQSKVHKAKGYAFAGVGSFFAIFFLVVAIVVAIIDLGLQLDRNGDVHFSGLMISSVIFVGLSVILFALGWIPLFAGSKPEEPPAQTAATDPWLALAEEFLTEVLKQLNGEKKSDPGAS